MRVSMGITKKPGSTSSTSVSSSHHGRGQQLYVVCTVCTRVRATDTFDSKTDFVNLRFGIKSVPDAHEVLFSVGLPDAEHF